MRKKLLNLLKAVGAVVALTALLTPGARALTGDFNSDNQVNVGDVSALYEAILSGTAGAEFDLNGDGNVNAGDISSLYDIILNGGDTVDELVDDTLPDWTVLVTWADTEATVKYAANLSGLLDVANTDAHVAVLQNSDIANEITYVLSGSSSNGSFYQDGSYKITLQLNGLNLTCVDSAAVNIQDGKRIAVELVEGTDNALADVSGGSGKGAMMVNGHTEFKGEGALTLTGNVKHAFWGDEYVELKKTVGTITVASAVKDGFSINQYFEMKGGTVNISNVGDDGIQTDLSGDDTDEHNGEVIISGGNLTIANSAATSKGINAASHVTISGGTIDIQTSGATEFNTKKLKLQASACISSDSTLTITGGTLTAKNIGVGGKGIKSDLALNIAGGNIEVTTTGASSFYTYDGVVYDQKPNAIGTDTELNISNGEITATVAGDAAKALKADLAINVTGGTVNATTSGNGVWDSVELKTKAASCLGSDGDINIDGGTLVLTSTGHGGKGISCDGTLTVNDGYITATTSGSAVVYNGSTLYNGNYSGNLDNIDSDYKSSAKGIKADSGLVINGGNLIVTSGTSEGIESKAEMTIAGGVIEVNSYDDCINSSSHMNIKGGKIFCNATNNDAIDSNGNLNISGGLIVAQGASGAECGIDANDEGGYHLYVTGGTIVGIGGSNISRPYNTSGYQPVLYYSGTISTNVTYTINDANGNNILAFTLDRSYSNSGGGGGWGWAPSLAPGGPGGGMGGGLGLIVSSPNIKTGTTYYLKSGQTASGEAWHNLIENATLSGTGTQVAYGTANSYYTQLQSNGSSGPGGGW